MLLMMFVKTFAKTFELLFIVARIFDTIRKFIIVIIETQTKDTAQS